jgi:anti-anti-sigma factor
VEGYRGKNYSRIIIDMRKVTFIDSEALGGFIFLSTLMKKSGIQLLLAGSEALIDRLFRDCCLDKVVSLVDAQEFKTIFPNALNTQ